jgi:hypothetical protein
MKFRTDTAFEKFSFHDASIVTITQSDEDIVLELKFAFILADHPANLHSEAMTIKPCNLRFVGVTSSDPQVFGEDTRVFTPHPHPDHPLDNDIVGATQLDVEHGSAFMLEGFHRAGWTEWTIRCTSFLIEWDSFPSHAWWVNWPGNKN